VKSIVKENGKVKKQK